ncbi:hypothetical protein [Streptosporangium sandarakinum]|uniref:hypothetical protein n=1 Tax=Streptosporangium sandarakinum TaxID=1260955 RepID=UPI0037A65CE2
MDPELGGVIATAAYLDQLLVEARRADAASLPGSDAKERLMSILLNKHELAEILGVPVSWVEDKCAARMIPHLKLNEYKFTQAHVAEILTMHERRPVEKPAACQKPYLHAQHPASAANGIAPLTARPVEASRRRSRKRSA